VLLVENKRERESERAKKEEEEGGPITFYCVTYTTRD
jgi:hypothetical protein